MPEHIEREKALKLIESAETWGWSNNTLYDEMKNLPTADVAPVVHGKWESGNPICPICGNDKFKGLDADIWADWMPPFCPNCGAKMDLKEDKECLNLSNNCFVIMSMKQSKSMDF